MLLVTKQRLVVIGYLIIFLLTTGGVVWTVVNAGWVSHSSSVNEAISYAENVVQMAQVQGQFKMASIANSRSLEDYRKDALESVDKITGLVGDNVAQTENAQELHNAVQRRFEIQDRSIEFYFQKVPTPESQVTASAQAIQGVSMAFKRLNEQENLLMRQRFEICLWIGGIGLVLLFVGLTLSATWTFRALSKQLSLADRVSSVNIQGTPLENDPTIAEIRKVLTSM